MNRGSTKGWEPDRDMESGMTYGKVLPGLFLAIPDGIMVGKCYVFVFFLRL